MLNLTPQQSEIVHYVEGPILVTAGPGSGKTRVLTERISYLIENEKGRVLALTFSNKAAEEISERIATKLSIENQGRIEVGTIHSFCLDVVTNKGNQIGLPSNLTILNSSKDKIEILKKIFINNNLDIPDSKNLDYLLLKIQKQKQEFIYPDMMINPISEEEMHFINIYQSYNNFLENNRLLDFDDILYYAYKILTERPKVAKNYTRLYKYILVDEAQDLNNTQYKILLALTHDFNNIMLVGDPAQSIYGFNGSDSSIMTEKFIKDYKPKTFILGENFRSAKKIIEAAKKIQVDTKTNAVFPIEGILEQHSFEDETKEAEWIIDKIQELLENGSEYISEEIKLSDITIIARNKYLFKSIENILKDNNIDFYHGGTANKLECESLEMKIFEMGLSVLINPHDDLHFNQINKYLERKSINNDYLSELLNNETNNNNSIDTPIFRKIIESWNMLYKNENSFIKALKNILTEKESMSDEFRFLIQNDISLWENRWNNYCKQTVGGNRSLLKFTNQIALGKMNSNNDSASGIPLLTVHSSKGLEFEIVFIIGLTDGTFPDYRVKTDSQKIEEKNNMFVALTRAKRECYLTYPKSKLMPWGSHKRQSPSEYLGIIFD